MAITVWSACVIGLALVCAAPAPSMAQDTPPEKCIFEGVARNRVTQLPLSKVTIRLIPDNGSIAYTGSSEADGSFRFQNVVPGDYRVEARRTGYSSPWVLSDKVGHTISSLHLTQGQALTANILWFTPDGSVSGTVIGPDGEPLPSAVITLIVRKWRHGKRVFNGADTATTDDAGVFHFASLAPGRYWVYAARPNSGPLDLPIEGDPGKPDMRIAGRYYPTAAQPDGAQGLEVRAGENLSGIDFKLPLAPVYHVSGNFTGSGEHTTVGLKARYGGQALDWTLEGASLGNDGKFDFASVISGDYFLDKLPLTVGTQDIVGLAAQPLKRFELKGRLRVDGNPVTGNIPALVTCEGRASDAYSAAQCRAEPLPDGTFTIHDLTADRYAIAIANLDTGNEGGFYLKTLRVNGVDVAGREIDLTGGPVDSLELVLSPDVGGLQGVVIARDEPEDLNVVMIPEKVSSGSTQPVYAYLDPTGHFQKTDLEPGTYRVFAAPADDQGVWQSPDFLREIASRGTTVDVAEKSTTRIEVHALRSADLRQVEERVE